MRWFHRRKHARVVNPSWPVDVAKAVGFVDLAPEAERRQAPAAWLPHLTRVDITDKNGRRQYGWPHRKLSFSVQDSGRTLKVYVAPADWERVEASAGALFAEGYDLMLPADTPVVIRREEAL